MSRETRMRRLLRGMREIEALAEADAAADPDRYPEDHPIWAALQWLSDIIGDEARKTEAPDAR